MVNSMDYFNQVGNTVSGIEKEISELLARKKEGLLFSESDQSRLEFLRLSSPDEYCNVVASIEFGKLPENIRVRLKCKEIEANVLS